LIADIDTLHNPKARSGDAPLTRHSQSTGPTPLAASIVLLGLQTLALQSMIQVVYPV
jgi:hypothetical protein